MLLPIKKVHSVWDLFSAVMIGYAVNNVLPRGGELLRPYVYSRREKISFSSTFATIIVERVIDLFYLMVLFFGVFLFFRDQIIKALPSLHAEKILIPTILILGVIVLSLYPPIFRFIINLVVKPLSNKLHARLVDLFDKFVKGLEIIKRPSQYFRISVESLAIWLCYTIPLYLMFFAFNFNVDYSMRFDDAILLIVIVGFGTTIAPTPGAIGFYHVFVQATLVKIYNISPTAALAYATVNHGVPFLLTTIVGGLFLIRENVKTLNIKGVTEEPPPNEELSTTE
jgi:uncharacterized protein (TIRG00374 family)